VAQEMRSVTLALPDVFVLLLLPPVLRMALRNPMRTRMLPRPPTRHT
jgi:hypothetical protein